jgi:hypothetical protein
VRRGRSRDEGGEEAGDAEKEKDRGAGRKKISGRGALAEAFLPEVKFFEIKFYEIKFFEVNSSR